MRSSYGWLVSNTVDECLQRQIAQKIENQKSKLVLSTLVTSWLSNIAFHLRPIWLQSLVAIDSELRLTSFPSFCAPPSEVAVLFDSNLSRRPFLGQVAFHLRPIWLQTLVAIDSESCLTSFPRFCAPPSEVAVLFDSNLSRRPFLGQVVDSDLLLCTGFDLEHADLFLCHIFSQRPVTDRRLSKAMGAALVGSSSFHIKKNDSLQPEIYKALKPC